MKINQNQKVLVLDWKKSSREARELASLLIAAQPVASMMEIRAAALCALSFGLGAREIPRFVCIPDGATDVRIVPSKRSSQRAFAVVDGKIVDCTVISDSKTADLLPSEIMETAWRLFRALQKWGEYDEYEGEGAYNDEYDECEYDEYDDDSEDEDDSDEDDEYDSEDEYDDDSEDEEASDEDSDSDSEEEVVSL